MLSVWKNADMSDNGKLKYELIQYNGVEARKYPDGSIRNDNGHWLTKHPGAVDFTSESAHEHRARTIAARQEAAEQGVANYIAKRDGLEYPVGTVEAWAKVTERVAEAFDSPKYRDRTDALRALADVTMSKYDKTTQIQPATAQQLAIGTVNLVLVAMRDKVVEQNMVQDDSSRAVDGTIVDDGD